MKKSTGIILKKENKYLMQLRDNIPTIVCPGLWGLFGGGVEEGETPEEAIIREVYEEINLELNKNQIKKILETHIQETYVYLFEAELNDLSKLKLKEGEDMKLFTKQEIIKLKNIIPEVKQFFKTL